MGSEFKRLQFWKGFFFPVRQWVLSKFSWLILKKNKSRPKANIGYAHLFCCCDWGMNDRRQNSGWDAWIKTVVFKLNCCDEETTLTFESSSFKFLLVVESTNRPPGPKKKNTDCIFRRFGIEFGNHGQLYGLILRWNWKSGSDCCRAARWTPHPVEEIKFVAVMCRLLWWIRSSRKKAPGSGVK